MTPCNTFDKEALEEIKARHFKICNLTLLAREQLRHQKIYEARQSIFEARELSIYSGDGAELRIINDRTDLKNWHALTKWLMAIG